MNTIEVRALKINQIPDIPVFSFFLTGEEILGIAEISRVKKDGGGELLGYQRGEVRQHVAEITDYLNSGEVLFPNAILLALSSDVRFKQSRGPKVGNEGCQAGTLAIPTPIGGKRAAWIVDGQQRTLALSRSSKQRLLVPVTAFVTDDFQVQRTQFLLVNKVKPLPIGLINELLPAVNTTLPQSFAKNRIPSALCDILNQDPESPFKGLLIRETTDLKENKAAVITDTSLLLVIRKSMNDPHGCLYQYRNSASGETDIDAIRKVMNLFWSEVKECFPEAWGRSPSESRLMNGVGIRSMGVLMDRIMANLHPSDPETPHEIRRYLERLKPHCAWTEGNWEILAGIPWNAPQNNPTNIRDLTRALIAVYTGQFPPP
jgi:DGQHR domain-containing protein